MEYIVGGAGNSSANVIESGLNDVKGSYFHILWTGKPTAGQARVLDWLIDHSAKFSIYTESGKVPPAVGQSAEVVVKVDDLVEDTFFTALVHSENSIKVLVLFDEDESGEPTELTQRMVFGAHDRGLECLELTNGLAPISVDSDNAPSEAPRKPQDAPKPEVVSTPRMEKVLTTREPVMQITVYSDGTAEVKNL
jgi:hypothetical protein